MCVCVCVCVHTCMGEHMHACVCAYVILCCCELLFMSYNVMLNYHIYMCLI